MKIDEFADLCRRAAESRLHVLAILNNRPAARPTVKKADGGFRAGLMSVDPEGQATFFWSTGLGHMSTDPERTKTYLTLRQSKQVARLCFDAATVPPLKKICPSRERIELI